MSQNYGHYGKPAILLAIAVGAALILHLLAPYGVVDYRGPAAPEDDVVWMKEAYDLRSTQADAVRTLNASPGVALAGGLVMALGATLLIVMGHQPLTVVQARWFGSLGGLVTIIGAAMATMSSMYSVGTGFSTFLGTVFGTEFRTNFWAISPIFVAAASMYAVWQAISIMTKVVGVAGGMRAEAAAHLHVARWGFIAMAVTLIVPWSIGLVPDGLSDRFGGDFGDDTAPLFFSAEDVQGATLAESAMDGRLRYNRDGDWDYLSATIHTFLAASWIAIMLGALGGTAGVARSVGAGAGLSTFVRGMQWLVAVIGIVSALLMLLSLGLFRPDSAEDTTFLPGFINFAAGMAGAYLALLAGRVAMDRDTVQAPVLATST